MRMVCGANGPEAGYDEDGMVCAGAARLLGRIKPPIMSRIVLLLLPLVLASSLKATDLFVSPGGAYPTINAAIAAAAQGDRLLIQPAQYNENVVVTKSLELLCNVSGQRYTVNGDVVFAPATTSRTVVIMDAWVLDSIRTGSVVGSGHVLTAVACKANSFHMAMTGVNARLLRDTILGNVTVWPPTDVIGCYITGRPGPNQSAVNVAPGSTVQNGLLNRIVGNVIGASMTYAGYGLTLSAFTPFQVQNNYFVMNGPDPYIATINISDFIDPGFVTTTPCIIQNNTIRWAGVAATPVIRVMEQDPLFTLDIRNNLLLGNATISASGPAVTLAYNVTSNDLAQVNALTGAPINGSVAINAGDPDAMHTDLDLTRNDAGCFGGSFSRDNFDEPLPSSASIVIMNVPRRTQAAAMIPITAEGIDH